MSQTSVCPGRAVLDRLRAGSLFAHEQKAVETHCDGCAACQAVLEELAYDEEGSPRPIPCPRLAVLKRYLGWRDGSIGLLAVLKRSLGFIDSSISVHAYEALEHHLSTCQKCNGVVEQLFLGTEPGRRPISCPQPMDLERLLDGSLAPQEQSEIEHHLETCDACQARLDSIASGGLNLQGEMRSLRQGSAPESPGLKRVIGDLKDELEPEMEANSTTVSAPAEILDLLDRPDMPGDLGKLGPYRVQEVLGKGGMGIVLKAFDSTLHRAVAIKILAPQLATSSSARQRFAREARAAAAIRNEHVVAIHSVDEWKGLPYLVMEFIPGGSLQARIDRSAPLDLHSILRIGMQAAKGLAAAHSQGLVHRDIKPANILLENCVERVKITDFGLARAVDDASLTQSGVVAGTPLFMAPEQARSETVDHRADLFSLGAVLYAMCTGRSPFRASTTLGVLKRVCDDTHRPVREVNPDVPEWLARVIDRLLAKDRAGRYQTADEVVDVLGTQLATCQRGNGQCLETGPFPLRQTIAAVDDVGPAKMHRKRRRWLEIMGSLIVVLAGLFVIAEVTGATRMSDIASIAQALGLRKPNGLIVVHLSSPDLRILINDNLRLTAVDTYSIFMRPSGCVVDVFKGGVKIAHEYFMLKPGMMVELDVLKDGRLVYGYDGPIRPALPRSVHPETPGPLMNLEDPEQHRLLVERIAQGIRTDAQAMSLLGQIRSTTENLEHNEIVGRGGTDPAVFALQERLWELQLKDLQRKYSERVRTISETIRRQMKNESVPDQEKRRPLSERSELRERIEEEFKRDPEVVSLVSLIEQIKAATDELERIRPSVKKGTDPALLAAHRRLKKLNQEYNNLWKTKSEGIRQRLYREQPLPNAEYFDLWKSKNGGIRQRSQRE